MGELHLNHKIHSLKTLRTHGHRNGLLFQPQGNKIVVRSMPEHYHDANSEAQQPCRNKMKWVMQMHALLKDAYRGCFQGEKSDYHQFRHYNLLSEIGQCIISHGTLPNLNIRVIDHHLEFDMNPIDWKPGDTLRLISLPEDLQHAATYHDTIINTPKSETVATEALPSGFYSFVHLRPTRRGFMASSQKLEYVM